MLGLSTHKEWAVSRSAVQFQLQRAGKASAACWNLRLQASDGRTKPSDGHQKPAYVHPKAANGDFTKHGEDFYQAAGRNDEG